MFPLSDTDINHLTAVFRFLEEALSITVNFTFQDSNNGHTFEAIMLSFRGAERQKKSHLAMALMFDAAIDSKIAEMQAEEVRDALTKDKSDTQLRSQALDLVIEDYNTHKAVATQRRWQLLNDDKAAVRNLALFTCEGVRRLMASHLDSYKGCDSGASLIAH